MIGIFLVRSMRDFLLVGGHGDTRRQIFLFGIVIAQVFLAWFMGSLADWSSNQNVVEEVVATVRDAAVEASEEGILTNTAVL